MSELGFQDYTMIGKKIFSSCNPIHLNSDNYGFQDDWMIKGKYNPLIILSILIQTIKKIFKNYEPVGYFPNNFKINE